MVDLLLVPEFVFVLFEDSVNVEVGAVIGGELGLVPLLLPTLEADDLLVLGGDLSRNKL